MPKVIKRLLKDERGATAIEYGFTTSLIAVVFEVAAHNVGSNVGNIINNVSSKL